MLYRLLILVMLCSFQSFSQTIVKSSIDSGGLSFTNSETQLIYTIGEVVVNEVSAGDIELSEGFISNDKELLSLNDVTLLERIRVYPNPTTGVLFINDYSEKLTNVELYTVLVQLLDVLYTDLEKISLNNLNTGVYFLKLNFTNGSNTIRIVKE